MGGKKKPILPLLWPWCDLEGTPLRPIYLLRSRAFSYTYVIVVLGIWNFIGPGHWSNCVTLGERLACSGGLWPEKIFSATHEFYLSFFTAPLFHNSSQHIFYVVFIGFIIFVQSFEGRNGAKATFIMFYLSILIAGTVAVLTMHIGHSIWPDNEIFASALKRYWTGGSGGFMGVLGALSHHSRRKWTIPVLLILFEIWNRYGNGISEFITFTHLTSALFGYIIWGWWLQRQSKTADSR